MRKFTRLLTVVAIAIAIPLAGCAGLGETKLGLAVKAVTTTIVNPVGTTDIYRVKNAYAAALELAVEYRRYCWSKPYAVLLADPVSKPVCANRRAAVRFAQSAQRNAGGTIAAAENFVANNPTLNASTLVAAAWQAVTDFQNAIPK